MEQANQEIYTAKRVYNVRHWQISKAIGISEMTLTRWLREPLTRDKEEKIMRIIKELGNGGQNG